MSSRPWYAWFPADYRAKTAHLTFEQDGAYRRLLDAYYERRGPLPADKTALYRLTSAQDERERVAIDAVVGQYFENGDGQLRHHRCDEQIAKEQAMHRRVVEGGRKGGLSSAQARLDLGLEGGLQAGLQGSSSIPHSHSHPDSDPKIKSTVGLKPDLKRDYLKEAKDVLQYLNKNAGKAYRPVDSNLKLIVARLKSGATATQLREVVHSKCEQWGKDPKMMEYLRPATLFNATKFEQYLGEL